MRIGMLAPMLVAAAAAEVGRRLLTPRAPVTAPAPIDVRDYFSEPEIARGRAYARPQRGLALARSAVELAALALVVARPPRVIDPARPRGRAGRAGSIAQGAATAAGLTLGLAVPGLPLRAIARRRSIAAGLDTQSWGGWASDLATATAIQTALSAAAGAGVLAVARRHPQRWWLPASVGSVGVALVLGALAPVALDPIFNDFTRLPEDETRADVLALARDAGVRVGEVYSVDASRRTTAANAYVTGLGPTKRVVLYDTMLDRYSRDEIRLVVAHELGHLRHRDVPRNVAYAAIVMPAVAWGVQRAGAALVGPGPDRRRGVTPSTLPALALAATLVSAPLAPIAARLSRAVERRADEFSLRLAGGPEAFISFERGAALQNLADLEPRWLSRQLASHPPTDERIGAAVAFAETAHAITGAAPAAPASR